MAKANTQDYEHQMNLYFSMPADAPLLPLEKKLKQILSTMGPKLKNQKCTKSELTEVLFAFLEVEEFTRIFPRSKFLDLLACLELPKNQSLLQKVAMNNLVLGELCDSFNITDEALKYFDLAIDCIIQKHPGAPTKVIDLKSYIKLMLQQGKADECHQKIEKMVEINDEYLDDFALICLKEKRYESATNALRREPKHPSISAHLLFIELFTEVGSFREAASMGLEVMQCHYQEMTSFGRCKHAFLYAKTFMIAEKQGGDHPKDNFIVCQQLTCLAMELSTLATCELPKLSAFQMKHVFNFIVEAIPEAIEMVELMLPEGILPIKMGWSEKLMPFQFFKEVSEAMENFEHTKGLILALISKFITVLVVRKPARECLVVNQRLETFELYARLEMKEEALMELQMFDKSSSFVELQMSDKTVFFSNPKRDYKMQQWFQNAHVFFTYLRYHAEASDMYARLTSLETVKEDPEAIANYSLQHACNLHESRRYEEAIELYDKYFDEKSRLGKELFWRPAMAFISLKNYSKGIEYFSKFVQLSTRGGGGLSSHTFIRVFLACAFCYTKLGMHDEATLQLQSAVKMALKAGQSAMQTKNARKDFFPTQSWVLFMQMVVAFERKKSKEAQKLMKKFLNSMGPIEKQLKLLNFITRISGFGRYLIDDWESILDNYLQTARAIVHDDFDPKGFTTYRSSSLINRHFIIANENLADGKREADASNNEEMLRREAKKMNAMLGRLIAASLKGCK